MNNKNDRINKYYSNVRAKPGRKQLISRHNEEFSNSNFNSVSFEAIRCWRIAYHYNSLSPVDKISYEEWATKILLRIVKLFNRYCTLGQKYALKELEESEELKEKGRAKFLLRLIKLFNQHCNLSVKYSLRKLESEELEELEEGEGDV